VVEAAVTDPLVYLDYFVAANNLALDRQDDRIAIHMRFWKHLATIEGRSEILRFSMHYDRDNRKYGFSDTVLPTELLCDQIWHFSIQNVLDLGTVMVNVIDDINIEEINIEEINSMLDVMKFLAIDNLKSRHKLNALKNDFERKYKNGMIANGNMTRVRKYTNTVVADSRTDVLLEIRERLAGMLTA
jgi:hypothetical protein